MKTIISCFVFTFMLITITNIVYASNVGIENVRANPKIRPGTWCMSGLVRNLENHLIKGLVKIKFLNSRGDIIKSAFAPMNGGEPIAPNQAGLFEYYADAKTYEDIVDYQIIFKDM